MALVGARACLGKFMHAELAKRHSLLESPTPEGEMLSGAARDCFVWPLHPGSNRSWTTHCLHAACSTLLSHAKHSELEASMCCSASLWSAIRQDSVKQYVCHSAIVIARWSARRPLVVQSRYHGRCGPVVARFVPAKICISEVGRWG